jgi:putative effector of murein hydrolase LrgA (UPF0299 family)
MRFTPDASDGSGSHPADRLLVSVGAAFLALAVLLAVTVVALSVPLGIPGPAVGTVVFTLLLAAVTVAAARLGRRRPRPSSR